MTRIVLDSSKANDKRRTWAMRLFVAGCFALLLKELLSEQRSFLQTGKNKISKTGENYDGLVSSTETDGLGTPVITMGDLKDLANTTANPLPHETWDATLVSREKVLDVLEQAGVRVGYDVLLRLPTWSEVENMYGGEPVILGLERCEEFRNTFPPNIRQAAVTGMFNTGTNALAKYFMENLVIPENPLSGFLCNAPWHKHGWLDLRNKYKFSQPSRHETVMPVVLIRDPWQWMQSMCESPYLLKWDHGDGHCPNLVPNSEVHLTLGMKLQHQRTWDTLAGVWSEWYREYYDAKFPRLMIRFEDLLFHTEQVMDTIRECLDGSWREDHFVYTTKAVKQREYFTKIKPQSSMLSAIIKYGRDSDRRTKNMTKADMNYARKHLDSKLMEVFNYKHPQ